MPATAIDDVRALDLLEARQQAQHAGDADVGHERRGDAQVLERAARFLGDRRVGGAGGDDRDGALDARHGLADRRGGASPSARRSRRGPGSGERGDLLPARRREARDEHVVGPRELAADLADLLDALALGEHDFRETDAAQPVEVERVVGSAHPSRHSMRRLRSRGRRGKVCALRFFESFGEGKRVKIPRGPRHCHRGRLGRQSTGSERSAWAGRASGKEPDGGDPEARRPAGRHASRTGFTRDAPSNSVGAGRFSARRDIRPVEREVRMATRVLLVPILIGALLPLASAAQLLPPASEEIVVTATSVPEDEKDVGSAITVITREELEKHEIDRGVRRPALGAGARPHAVRHARLADVALHPRDELDADARADRRRADELAVLRGLRLVRPDDGEHRAHRGRARAVLGPLRLRRHRRRRPDLHPAGRGGAGRPGDGRVRQPGRGPGLRVRFVRARDPSPRRRAIATWPSTATAPTPTGGSATRPRASHAQLCEPGAGSAWSGACSTARSGTPGTWASTRPRAASCTRGGSPFRRRSRSPTRTSSTSSSPASARSPRTATRPEGSSRRRTRGRTRGRVSDTAKLGAHTLTAFASWERWEVDDESNFGPNLDDARRRSGAWAPRTP